MTYYAVAYKEGEILATFQYESWAQEWKDKHCHTCVILHGNTSFVIVPTDDRSPIELVNPERNASPRTPNQGDEAGNQNKTSNSEATILSAEDVLKKHDTSNIRWRGQYDNVLSAMEEYHNQFK